MEMATRSRINAPHTADSTRSDTSSSPPTRNPSAPTSRTQHGRTDIENTEGTLSGRVEDIAVRALGFMLVLGALAFAFFGWVFVLL